MATFKTTTRATNLQLTPRCNLLSLQGELEQMVHGAAAELLTEADRLADIDAADAAAPAEPSQVFSQCPVYCSAPLQYIIPHHGNEKSRQMTRLVSTLRGQLRRQSPARGGRV